MKVYTYYQPIQGNGAAPVIEMWQDSWRAHGWTPIILGEADFNKLPFAGAIDFAARRLPTPNSAAYELACYRRWLAMAGVGGGFMSDYDVLNFGFRPEHVPPHNGKLLRFNRRAPCAVYGNIWNYLQAVDMFLSYTPQPDDLFGDKMRVEDMTILNKYSHVSEYHDLCSEYNPDNSDTENLIHFCSAQCGDIPKPEAIRCYMAARAARGGT